MVYKPLYINIIIRVAFLTATCLLLGLLIPRLQSEYVFTTVGTIFLILLQIYLLIHYLNKTNRNLALFFQNIENKDSSLIFPVDKNISQADQLLSALNKLNDMISAIRVKSRQQSIYLATLIDQLSVGVIAFRQDGQVKYFNKAASQLLNIAELEHIRGLDELHPDFSKELIIPGKSRLFKLAIPDPLMPNTQKVLQLSMNSSILKLGDEIQQIVTLQDIVPELERKELDSWHKLIRVLTHEIMNSISPIISLSSHISSYLELPPENPPTDTITLELARVEKALEGLHTITETSTGLMDFVNNYRSLTQLPQPKIEKVNISNVINETLTLIQQEDAFHDIEIETKIKPKDLIIPGDPKQLVQVLLNLVKNSCEALKEIPDKKINIVSYLAKNQQCIIKVIDNGSGIPKEEIESIFVPFFTTKENGSGIGLSLSSQIIRMHGGQLLVSSMPGKETTFAIKL